MAHFGLSPVPSTPKIKGERFTYKSSGFLKSGTSFFPPNFHPPVILGFHPWKISFGCIFRSAIQVGELDAGSCYLSGMGWPGFSWSLGPKNRPFWIKGLWSKLELINDSFLYYLEKWEFGPYLDDHSRTCKWLVNIIYCATGNLPCCLPSRFWRWQPAELNFCKMQQLHRRKLRRPVGSNCS